MTRKRAYRAGEAETPVEGTLKTPEAPSRVVFAATIVEVYRKLEKIEALCENPHWNSERRWRIAGLAREAMNLLEDPTK